MDHSKLDKKSISILGCGWLGLPLAQRIIQDDISTHVKGSTTTPEKIQKLEANGISAFLIQLDPDIEIDADQMKDFLKSDLLIVDIPPGLRRNSKGFHIAQIEKLLPFLQESPVKTIIYISSTSVYPNLNRIVYEEDVTTPDQADSDELVVAENLFLKLIPEKNITIVRFGGLLGYDRVPGKYVQGKKDLTTKDTPVNYIHRDDAIRAIIEIIINEPQDETFNIVAPIHSKRGDVYLKTCLQFGWQPPTFTKNSTLESFKIISSKKFQDHYNFDFKYPDPINFYYEL